MMYTFFFVEDDTHRIFVELLVPETAKSISVVKGCGYFHSHMKKLKNMSQSQRVVVMLDKDIDDICIQDRISGYIPFEQYSSLPNLMFLIPVNEIESWILADRQGFAEHFKVPLNKLPQNPDTLDNPKESLINIIRQYSIKMYKDDLVPIGSEPYGRNYFNTMKHFIHNKWSQERATQNSPSLKKCLEHIEQYIL